ncbi:hypothetical protein FisN_4Lh117 [Fistulifera solaris]|uniref:U3 small nucleolar RNA-associated protein 5 n=1 Tax=Fistulifera solaris TaxID=1519565 RepID=A0A1Z5JZM8_FISSO|nr:hypothetical protein FisN_4Lh117 [Fistulifera solaris]|eukprot:GAX19306.1 hypothetical protein FisN_4Lh117 [Fistulifera solaris]
MAEESIFISANFDDQIAVVLSNNSASVLRVGIYLARDLQATLTYKTAETVRKVLFVNATTFAALLKTTVVVWDLQRCVVAYTYPPATNKEFEVMDGDVSDNSLHLLISKSEKLYIHKLDEQGALKSKVKAGKSSDGPKIALLKGGVAAVAQNKELRFLELQNGQKTKVALTFVSSHIAAADGLLYVASPGNVHVYTADGKAQDSFSVEASVQYWQVIKDRVLINGTHLYDKNKLARKFHVDPTIARASLLLNQSGVWAIMQKGILQVRRLDLDSASASDETFVVNWEETKIMDVDDPVAREKRKAVVLGPGQAGGDARQIKEVSAKRQKIEEGEGENDEEEEEGPTIAERLEQLQKVLDEDDEGSERENESENMDVDGGDLASSFQPKKATTESLSQLLQQALQSGDDGLLELALSVKDAKVIETTCGTMASDLLSVLLTALTSRLALKPSRAEYLCSTWLSILLRTGRIRSPEQLQTLRNIVQERVEVFPALLQLEGKLSLLG